MSHNIDFSGIEWTVVAEGFRYKAVVHGNQQIRLAEFSEGLKEPDWCRSGHSGYVLDGECRLDFSGKSEYLKKGDVFHIPSGVDDKHMVIMEKGEWIQVLLFEYVALV
jgi:quercetin dioxygenase-like cupin family protein